jgi:hypothetical protein
MGPQWFKSSYSADTANCIEVAYRKSTYSSDTANCVEVALRSPAVGVRDSKDPALPALLFPSSAWSAFLGQVR